MIKPIETASEWNGLIFEHPEINSVVLFRRRSSQPCDQFQAHLEAIKSECTNTVGFFICEYESSPDFIYQFRVSILPTIMVFRGKQKLAEFICNADLHTVTNYIKGL
jgi:thioredoxin-like negative regulator of GroEL